jgi:membrane-associated progesterone receptor component
LKKSELQQLVFVFTEKYDYVGRLLKPGEEPTNYSDEEEEGSQQESAEKSKDE